MTPPVALVDLQQIDDVDVTLPTKRRKLEDDDMVTSVSSRHPLGVRPSGNAFLASRNLKNETGGFAALPDELLSMLLDYLGPRELLDLGATCRALHAFTRNDDLWRALFTQSSPSSFTWRGTWRSTFLKQSKDEEPDVDCSELYSDVLHRPFFCSHVSLDSFVTSIPARNQILRLEDCSSEFVFRSSRPFILTKPTRRWPVFGEWTVDTLLTRYKHTKFRAEAVDWEFATYASYMRNNQDESPLYLFDRDFAEKMNIHVPDSADAHLYESETADREHLAPAAYWPPTCFGRDQDLFSVLGPQRPDHRWLIIGPARSGSTFHKDPNGTSAWNAVLTGRKYWIMFPSSSTLPPPPGVYVSADQSEVTSPLSIAEWLLAFHAEARATPGCKEGICHAGELLYVPEGWYHLVLNLDESIALTQNFVPRSGLPDVLAFLRDKPDQVTGFRDVDDPYDMFVTKLMEKEPKLLNEALAKLEKRGTEAKGKWEEIRAVNDADGGAGGFSFGFGGDEDDDDIP